MVGTNILIRGGIRKLLMRFMLRRVSDFEKALALKEKTKETRKRIHTMRINIWAVLEKGKVHFSDGV